MRRTPSSRRGAEIVDSEIKAEDDDAASKRAIDPAPTSPKSRMISSIVTSK